AGAFLLFRQGHGNAFVFMGGETILWALMPWAIVVNVLALDCATRHGRTLAAGGGCLTACLLIFKYSAALAFAGVVAVWCWHLARRTVAVERGLAWAAGLVIATPALVASGVLTTLAGRTPLGAGCATTPVKALAWTAVGPLMGLADIGEALNTF